MDKHVRIRKAGGGEMLAQPEFTEELILLARDASDNARDRAEGFARRGAVPLVRLGADKASLASALGVSGGSMAAVCDAGFARALLEKFPEDTERI